MTDSFAQGLFALERNWRGSLASNAGVNVTLQQFQAMEKDASPFVLKNWRFQHGLYRAYYDAYVRTRLLYEIALEERAMEKLLQAKAIGSLLAMDEAERFIAEQEAVVAAAEREDEERRAREEEAAAAAAPLPSAAAAPVLPATAAPVVPAAAARGVPEQMDQSVRVEGGITVNIHTERMVLDEAEILSDTIVQRLRERLDALRSEREFRTGVRAPAPG